MDYKESGVDIEAGEKAVCNIKQIVRSTFNSNVLTELGSFGGLYRLDMQAWSHPVMVSSTDGVGTKLIVAQKAKRYDTVGQDLVNHCVNDIFVQGATPQFFNDYIGTGRLCPAIVEEIIQGMTVACRENEMSLIGGEMAEMPGIYREEDFDLVGTIVGLVEEQNIITGANIKAGDVIIGFASTGLHTNGYSLARQIIFEKLNLGIDSYISQLNGTVSELLLAVHKSYYPMLRKWATPEQIHGMAHITGGGLKGNIKRIIPEGLSAVIDCQSYPVPPLFEWLVNEGDIPLSEAYRVFNMGIGFVVIAPAPITDNILQDTAGYKIGIITPKDSTEPVILQKGGFLL
ncbi:MAG: phosphoribosylformylglycinamidine cyclo-ligase [Candidatus Cloacimonetes bacterium]|nr:phosphoribosylformylglycinamidine cyclo-ligase [Candidatus Cloacimonadota bacterium]